MDSVNGLRAGADDVEDIARWNLEAERIDGRSQESMEMANRRWEGVGEWREREDTCGPILR